MPLTGSSNRWMKAHAHSTLTHIANENEIKKKKPNPHFQLL